MRTWLIGIIATAVVWTALWPHLEPGNLVVGTVLGLALMLLKRREGLGEGRLELRPVAAARFLVFFLTDVVRASIDVTRHALARRPSHRPAVVRVPLRLNRQGLITVVANAVTLTPGSVTVDIERDPTALNVHLLHLSDENAVRAHIDELERLTVEAFGTPAERAAVGRGSSSP